MKTIFASFLLALSASTAAETINIDIDELNAWEPLGEPTRPAGTREKIFGTADFVKINALAPEDPNRALSTKVGQFIIRDKGYCSGALVGSDLFLTNHHCVFDTKTQGLLATKDMIVLMEHVADKDLGPNHSHSGVAEILVVNKPLDFALLRLSRPLGDRYGWLEIEQERNEVANVRTVKIIQHPRGRSKEIVTKNTAVVNCRAPAPNVGSYMCYMADTEGGSSGSPVFDLQDDKLIAIHHSGFAERFNAGTPSPFLYEHLKAYLGDLPTGQPAPPKKPALKKPAPKRTTPDEPKSDEPEPSSDDWEPVT